MDVFSIFRVAERMSILLVLPSAYWDLSLITLFKRLATRHGINYRTSVFQSLKTCLSVCLWLVSSGCVCGPYIVCGRRVTTVLRHLQRLSNCLRAAVNNISPC